MTIARPAHALEYGSAYRAEGERALAGARRVIEAFKAWIERRPTREA